MLFDFALKGQIGYPGWVQMREVGHTGIKSRLYAVSHVTGNQKSTSLHFLSEIESENI